MSTTISFKAPEKMAKEVEEATKEGNYTSKGEFLRSLLREVERKELSEKAKKDIEIAREQEGRPIDEL